MTQGRHASPIVGLPGASTMRRPRKMPKASSASFGNSGGHGTSDCPEIDPERDDLSYAVSRDARYGTVSIDSVTGQFTYTVVDPTAQADSFAVAVDDGHRAGTAVVVVSVDLSGVPEARKVDVVAGHSTLAIPCGDGCTVPADWYFPTGAEAPNGVIWLQHGFIAGAGWYDKLATQLAVQTNSIVVAPTLSSNPLTSGGKWLNGDVMQHAVADLLADRTALTASAAAAAGHPVELPDRIVLAGHSAGGGLAATVAGTRWTTAPSTTSSGW